MPDSNLTASLVWFGRFFFFGSRRSRINLPIRRPAFIALEALSALASHRGSRGRIDRAIRVRVKARLGQLIPGFTLGRSTLTSKALGLPSGTSDEKAPLPKTRVVRYAEISTSSPVLSCLKDSTFDLSVSSTVTIRGAGIATLSKAGAPSAGFEIDLFSR